jgi:hypothetical protein
LAFTGPVLAGALVLAALTPPALQSEAGRRILIAAAVGFVVAVPVAWTIARMNAGESA